MCEQNATDQEKFFNSQREDKEKEHESGALTIHDAAKGRHQQAVPSLSTRLQKALNIAISNAHDAVNVKTKTPEVNECCPGLVVYIKHACL